MDEETVSKTAEPLKMARRSKAKAEGMFTWKRLKKTSAKGRHGPALALHQGKVQTRKTKVIIGNYLILSIDERKQNYSSAKFLILESTLWLHKIISGKMNW